MGGSLVNAMAIDVIGIGAGSPAHLTLEGVEALAGVEIGRASCRERV